MLSDGFRKKYTTIPFAIYKNRNEEIGYCYSHYHKEVEILAVVEGQMDFYLDSDYYEVKAGEVLFIPPYSVHRSTAHPGTYHECLAFDLSMLWDDALRRDLENGVLTVKSPLTADLPYTPCVFNAARSALTAHKNALPGWEMEVIGNLSVILGKLLSESFFVKSGKADLEENFVKKVIEYVSTHLSEQITSGTASKHLFLNNSYFCRLFKARFGCSFTEYLTSRRIEQSKILLNTTALSISDVAFKCGFNSFSYFGKTFRRRTGISPSDYRRKKRKNQNLTPV